MDGRFCAVANQSQSRDRWVMFLLSVGVKSLRVHVYGVDHFESEGLLETGLEVRMPIILQPAHFNT